MIKYFLCVLTLLSFTALNCERNKIYDVIENGDSYLPNIHWKIPNSVTFVEVDTVFVKSDNSFNARVEIFYDDPKDFKIIEIYYIDDTRHLGLYKPTPGLSVNSHSLTDSKLDSVSDKIIIDFDINPIDFKMILLDIIISERPSTSYDLRRFKTLYIANSDSIKRS
jgi:hypothetical protein